MLHMAFPAGIVSFSAGISWLCICLVVYTWTSMGYFGGLSNIKIAASESCSHVRTHQPHQRDAMCHVQFVLRDGPWDESSAGDVMSVASCAIPRQKRDDGDGKWNKFHGSNSSNSASDCRSRRRPLARPLWPLNVPTTSQLHPSLRCPSPCPLLSHHRCLIDFSFLAPHLQNALQFAPPRPPTLSILAVLHPHQL